MEHERGWHLKMTKTANKHRRRKKQQIFKQNSMPSTYKIYPTHNAQVIRFILHSSLAQEFVEALKKKS